ncbi:threonylcarbamoyl-AMP synthase [Patescibacteria group bacterium]|nr:threonylcarbamoyl-AMP synthase [Patescibacteria group bacterium]
MKVIKVGNQSQAIKQATIKKAIAVLKKGGLVIYPTETCYGIGADATNLKAVEKVLQFKGSRGNKPVSIAVANKEMAEKYVLINSTAANLYKEFLPGPLTVVSKSRQKTARLLEAGQETLGIRIPDYDLIIKIIKEFNRPITSTSANTSGKKTPYCLNDVLKYTTPKRLGLVDLFLDAGRLPFHLPTTVVDTTLNEPKALRQGEIKIKATSKNTFISGSEEETKKIAQDIFKKYEKVLVKKSLIFALQGELGSGKTQFAKGLGLFLNIKNNITSPTFTIIREYPFSLSPQRLQRPGLCKSGVFYHLDTWRLEKGEELLTLGLEKMLSSKNVVAIEWMQKIRPILKQLQSKKKTQIIWVMIEFLSENQRRITYRG